MMIEQEQNEEHTKEESRTSCSVFVVTRYYPLNAFGRCSQMVISLFLNKLKIDKENKWANQKQRN